MSLPVHPAVTVRQVKAAWPVMRWILADARARRPCLDHMVGPDRRFSLMRGSLDQIVEIAHAHEAKVNDVLPSNIAAVQHELGALAASTTAGTGRGR